MEIYLCPQCAVCTETTPGLRWQCQACGRMDSDADELPAWSQIGGRQPVVEKGVHCARYRKSSGVACAQCRVTCKLAGMTQDQSRAAYAAMCAKADELAMQGTGGT